MKLVDPVADDTTVEIRSTGQQTLVGPSTHPDDGEANDLLTEEPAEVDAETLIAAVRALHAAVLRARGHERRPPPPTSRVPSPARPERIAGFTRPEDVPADVRIDRCKAYLTKCPDAVCHAGGDRATFRAACECFRIGLPRSDARAILGWFNDTKTVGERWTDAAIEHKLDRA